MTDSLDFISSSSYVIDILCLLDYRTILNCKLVNRRFYDVIKQSWRNRNLSRPVIYLWIAMNTEKTTKATYLVIDVYMDRKKSSIYILTDFCIYFWSKDEKKPISRYYSEHGIPFTAPPNSHDEEKLTAMTAGISVQSRYKRASSLVYKTKNFNDGYREFLSVLLRHYNIRMLGVCSEFFIHADLFLEIFAASGCSCKSLEMDVGKPSKGFDNFCTKLGCSDIELDMYIPLGGVISNTSRWGCPLQIQSYFENEEMMLPIVQLVRSWISGVFRIKYLSEFTFCREDRRWSFHMLFDLVCTNNIRPFHRKIFEDSRENDRKKHIVMLFRRNHDESTLCFACCPERKEIIVYDCIYKGNPDDFQCNYPEYFAYKF